MSPPLPPLREAGSGRPVVCLHSSASSGAQWRSLMNALAPDWRVICPDLYGYGKAADLASLEDFGLLDEVTRLEPLLRAAGEPTYLVGHSYGGLIALLTAVNLPQYVRAIVVYEPAAWSVAVNADPSHDGAREIEALRQSIIRLSDQGQAMAAAEAFIRYWTGDRGWESMPDDRRTITAGLMRKIRHEFSSEILAQERGIIGADRFAQISVPVGYYHGSATKASCKRLTEILAPALASAETTELEGLGHMGPVTHSAAFNAAVAAFLGRQG
ncbi:MAG: alpha/beta hydrolase [Burkholderiaceae bacterium]